jgi:hypothetical protein
LPHLTKQQIKLLALLAQKVFFDKNNLAWIRLDDYKYLRTALWLPEFYRKEALCESYNHLFAGHNAAQKTYIKLTTSYFWPNAYSHVVSIPFISPFILCVYLLLLLTISHSGK